MFLTTGERPRTLVRSGGESEFGTLGIRCIGIVDRVRGNGAGTQNIGCRTLSLKELQNSFRNLSLISNNLSMGGFNIALQRSLALVIASVTGSSVAMIDEDVDVRPLQVQSLLKLAGHNNVVGGRLTGDDSRDSISRIVDSEGDNRSSNRSLRRNIVNGGLMAVGSKVVELPFPPGYNETWNWCVILSRFGGRVYIEPSIVGVHKSTTELNLTFNALVAEQIGVLVYRLLWRLRNGIRTPVDVKKVLDSDEAVRLVSELSPARRLNGQDLRLKRGESGDVSRALHGVDWLAGVGRWSNSFEAVRRAWSADRRVLAGYLGDL